MIQKVIKLRENHIRFGFLQIPVDVGISFASDSSEKCVVKKER
ncbi:hypothetical protein AGMMS49592_3120 [Endomicrobiia bacterium]|nr:hypothetical protein AGMMS49592_3120 [Endomicrobiia bacterium]GHT52988.1 hypothetical protein AGMMS49990_10000 [Endomicrobiia bacterium]